MKELDKCLCIARNKLRYFSSLAAKFPPGIRWFIRGTMQLMCGLKRSSNYSAFIVLLVTLLVVSGCAPDIKNYPSLVNQGILPLSTTNPYLGSNLFIANEAEKSKYLYHFLSHRGAPSAIEITKEAMSNPHLILYYPRDREAYAADLQQYRKPNGLMTAEWVVRGPYPIERQDFRVLAQLETSLIGEPIFFLNGKEHRFRFQPRPESHVKPPLPDYIPTPRPTPRPAKRGPKVIVSKGDKAEGTPTAKATEAPQNFKNLSSDQMALLHAQGYALRDKNGDILHTVKSHKQTLEAIVQWYTGAGTALPEIAQLNGLKPAEPLPDGAKIRIPEALVKQPKLMP